VKNTISIYLLIIGILVNNNLFAQDLSKLPEPINSTQYRTVSPFISYDGKQIVFIMQTEETQKMAECRLKADGTWEGPFLIDAVNQFDSVPFFIEAPSYNHDASELYFALKYDRRDASFDIYFTKKEKGKWLKPEKLPGPINSDKDDTDPFMSSDGRQLYLARNIDNDDLKKFDCYEILVAERSGNEWKIPVALPSPVNSGCDRAPRLASDGKTLYFSSIRADGKNMSDIYFAKKITKNAWTAPVLTDTLNNTEDETYPSVTGEGEYLYFQMGTGKKKERNDQFVKIKQASEFMPEQTVHVHGKVTDLNTEQPLSASITVYDPNTSIVQFEAKTNDLTGEYSFYLQKDRKYRIDFHESGYSHYFFNYETNTDQGDVQKDIRLFPEIDLIINVYDSEIYEPLNSDLKVYDQETGSLTDIKPQETEKGRYTVTLPIGKNYKIEAEKEYFDPNEFSLDLRGVVQFSEFERDIELPVKKVDYLISLSDEETGRGVETEVEIINLSTNEKIIQKMKTDKNGKLKIKLRDGTTYEINVSPKGYSYYNTVVNLVGEDPQTETEAKLTPLKKATKLELSDINFETNSADLNNSSFEELDRLVKLLLNNPQIKIEISAHTDDVGSSAYNLKLSDKRADSVKEYLLEQAIRVEQILSKGYGESKPKYLPYNTDENRAKNRRVELEVIDIQE
jgi:outer membrane protein OmpA-like peptidoglycan-associated protein/Tol biopolymer transport system component